MTFNAKFTIFHTNRHLRARWLLLACDIIGQVTILLTLHSLITRLAAWPPITKSVKDIVYLEKETANLAREQTAPFARKTAVFESHAVTDLLVCHRAAPDVSRPALLSRRSRSLPSQAFGWIAFGWIAFGCAYESAISIKRTYRNLPHQTWYSSGQNLPRVSKTVGKRSRIVQTIDLNSHPSASISRMAC